VRHARDGRLESRRVHTTYYLSLLGQAPDSAKVPALAVLNADQRELTKDNFADTVNST